VESKIILGIIISFFLSLLTSFFILKKFPQWNFLDNPKKFNFSRKPVPLPGGVGIPVIFALVAILFLPLEKHIIGFSTAVLLLTLICFLDDRKGLKPILRLILQIIIALILIASGIGIEVISNPFGGHIDLSIFKINAFYWQGDFYQITVLADLFTIAWVLILINTLNWLDGVVGLSTLSAASSGIVLGILSLTEKVNQPEIAFLSFIFAAAVFGFLPFNIPPVKMLLGDAGAMPLGLIIAVLAIFSGGKVATAFLVLALPILDAFFVIIFRLVQRKKPWEGKDQAHLHDRLLAKGWSEKQILLLFFLVAIFLGIVTLFLGTLGKTVLIILISLLFLFFRFIVL